MLDDFDVSVETYSLGLVVTINASMRPYHETRSAEVWIRQRNFTGPLHANFTLTQRGSGLPSWTSARFTSSIQARKKIFNGQ